MLVHLRRSLIMCVFCLVFFGFVYAFAGTGVAQVLFPFHANGSVTKNGSLLIGQNWSSPKWFHGRPDDTGPYAASATQSGGDNPLVANGHDGESAATNLGPHSKTLEDNTKALVKYWHSLGVNPTIDLVTTSGSGYDPDISAEDAMVQIPMVTKATGVAPAKLRTLIERQTHPALWGFMGSSYIDVLQLNEGLAKLEK
jgi:K+-transporting ATPase ATPase C chain